MSHSYRRRGRHAGAAAALLLALAVTAAGAQSSAPGVMEAYGREVLQGEGYTSLVASPSGALREDAAQDFAVSMTAGTEYAFYAMCDSDCDDIDLIVLGPDGRQVATDRRADDAPTIRMRATASGTHTLRVSMASCSIEPCRFWARGYSKPRTASTGGSTTRSTAGPTAGSTAGALAAGQRCSIGNSSLSIAQGESVSGSLGARDCMRDDDSYARYYRLVLPARDSVTITMTSSAFDAFLVLQDSRGATVDTDDDGADGTNARIERTLAAGTYYVIANSLSSGGTGAFRLQVSSPRLARPAGTSTTTTAGALGAGASASTQTIDLSSHRTWSTGPSSSGRCAYAYSDGGYRIDILSPATCYPSMSVAFTGDNVRLSVTYRAISGANVRPGISFGHVAEGSRYVFSMNTSGGVRLSRWDGRTSSWTPLVSNVTSRYANTGLGATNMLSVELEGTTARLFVNGNLVSQRTLDAPPARNFTPSLQGGSAVFQRLDVRPVVTAGGAGW